MGPKHRLRSNYTKLYVQEPEANGLNRVVIVEFGPLYNNVMVQGADKFWVLGQLERIKRFVHSSEKRFVA